MKTTLSPNDLRSSVVAVPPLCRNADFSLNQAENARLVSHLEAGGVRILLYGGNANFYNVALSEYREVLDVLEASAGPDTCVIPSAGPYFGALLDQAAILRERKFPTAMVLPATFPLRPAGVAVAIRRFAEKCGFPVVVYLKNEGYLSIDDVRSLVADGCVSWIKYAIVRTDESQDPLLRTLCDAVDPALIVSGMGEQPAIVHWRDFRLGGFTSGCVCVAPSLSTSMLHALREGNFADAERLREIFRPLEDLRNAHGPIPVLHEAVSLAQIARTGPHLPLLADLSAEQRQAVNTAAAKLAQATGS
jgi:dihydrodipicolinate synthase/N-acetylneuraminate lyase